MRTYKNATTVLKTVPFAVESIEVEDDGETLSHPYHRLSCPDWVNVLPITKEGKALLVKQPRAGNEQIVVETPGGVCDTQKTNSDMPFLEDAQRELEEETGYGQGKWVHLLSVNPNPATHNNTLHLYLATDLEEMGERRTLFPDAHESIEIMMVDVKKAIEMAHTGKMGHALAVTCVLSAWAKGLLDEWI